MRARVREGGKEEEGEGERGEEKEEGGAGETEIETD